MKIYSNDLEHNNILCSNLHNAFEVIYYTLNQVTRNDNTASLISIKYSSWNLLDKFVKFVIMYIPLHYLHHPKVFLKSFSFIISIVKISTSIICTTVSNLLQCEIIML